MEAAEPDQAVRDHLQRGDWAAAATAGLRAHGPELLRYLRRVLANETIAQDAFSDFCERLWKAIPRFRGDASFRTWAYRLAWSAAAECLSDPARRRQQRLDTPQFHAVAEAIRTSTAEHLRTPARDRLEEARRSLSPEDRSLLILKIEEGLSWQQVAEVMGREGHPVNELALRKRFSRLRGRLRALMNPEKGGVPTPRR